MFNVTFISTRHEEIGKCNSYELGRIIELINPEIIFEELPPTYFNKYYISKTQRTLETDTINEYCKTHKIVHIPIDSEDVPPDSFFQEYKNMLLGVEGLADINGFHYRKLIDRNRDYIRSYGFDYLNNFACSDINVEINGFIENGLKIINSEKLFRTYTLWRAINDRRENEMFQNIYKYSVEHSFDKAIFLIGSAHRKSIMQKAQHFTVLENLKLNWLLHDPWSRRY